MGSVLSTFRETVAPRWHGVLDGVIHPRFAEDPVELTFERLSVAVRLAVALPVILTFPIFVLAGQAAGIAYGGLVALVMIPLIGIAISTLFGRSDIAALSVAGATAVAVVIVAGPTGGLLSPFILFLVATAFTPMRDRPVANAAGCVAIMMVAAGSVAFLHGVDGSSVKGFVEAQPLLAAWIACAALLPAVADWMLSGWRVVAVKRETKERLQRQEFLTEAMTDIVSRHDRDGRSHYVSPSSATVLDAPSASLDGPGWENAIHPADRAAFREAVSNAFLTGELVSAEYRMKRARLVPVELRDYASDSDYIWVETRCRANLEANVAEGELVAITRDISAHKFQERALQASREDAESASRAKTRFLASMSHELRTPLNAIIGFSEILNDEVFGSIGSERNHEYVKLIHDSGRHLLQLVNDILDTSRIETGKYQVFPEPFSLEPLIKSTAALVEPDATRKKLAVTTRIAAELPDLMADKRAVKQILLNLLSNAVKFTPENGRIHIDASFDDYDLVMRVTDTGIGISAEDLGRIGQPFVQADTTYSREHEGTGLGLSVVRGLVDLHHADFEIESEVGLGTTVSVRFRRQLPDEVLGDYGDYMRELAQPGRMTA